MLADVTHVGVRLVLHGELPDHCGCQQTGFLGDLSKNRFFQSLEVLPHFSRDGEAGSQILRLIDKVTLACG